MAIRCVWEHNGGDSLLYAVDYPGVAARGATLQTAMEKLPGEIRGYCRWAEVDFPHSLEISLVQEKNSSLEIRDADSDVLFDAEHLPLTEGEYRNLKALVLRSAADFHRLYEGIPDPKITDLPLRRCFYGPVPRTAEEMYQHTRSVNSYYFAEIDVPADNTGTILSCRERGFRALEEKKDFLSLPTCEGSYGEEWSLRKVMRRFLWHDRIHGKALYRMAVRNFGRDRIPDVFCFE